MRITSRLLPLALGAAGCLAPLPPAFLPPFLGADSGGRGGAFIDWNWSARLGVRTTRLGCSAAGCDAPAAMWAEESPEVTRGGRRPSTGGARAWPPGGASLGMLYSDCIYEISLRR